MKIRSEKSPTAVVEQQKADTPKSADRQIKSNRQRAFTGKALLCWLLALVPMAAQSAALSKEEPTATEIVTRTDRIRNPPGTFRMEARIVEYRSGVAQDSMQIAIHSKPDRESGQYRSVVKISEPVRDEGKLVLRNGSSLWFYDPAAKNSVRISPQQRLLGQASNGDVMTSNFARDYQPTLLGYQQITDAEKSQRDCFHLEMKASNPDVSYPRIEYWVDRNSYRPVKGRFYAESGRLLKSVYYRRFVEVLGAPRPTEVLIIDGVDRKKVTRMRFANHQQQTLPETWFQRDYLPRFGL